MALLERATHLADLRRHLQHVSIGGGRMVFVGGEAGIGKSSLLRVFADSSGARRVLWGACDPLATPRPLGPLLDMLPNLDASLGELVWSGAPRARIFRGLLEALERDPAPTLAVIEDAHWSDESSRDMLRYLGRRLESVPALVVVTYRDDEVGARHPFRVVLGDLAGRADVVRMRLGPLSVAGLAALAANAEVDVDVASLHARTGGNPFFASEILAVGGEGIPESVRDAVLARAARLEPEAREVLDAAAVIGSRLDPEVLLEVAGATSVHLEACLSSGMLVSAGDMLAFRHELARQALAGALPALQIRTLHRRTLDAMLYRSAEDRPDDLAALAHHAEGAGDAQAVLRFAPAAARQASGAHAHREAVAQYARALRFARTLAGPERAALYEAYAEETSVTDQLEAAVAARRSAIELRDAEGDEPAVAVNLARLSRLYVGLGRNGEAERAAREALVLLEGRPERPETAFAQANWAYIRMLDRDNAQALEGGERAVALARDLGDVPVLLLALNVVGAARILLGDFEGGRSALEECQRVARAVGSDLEFSATFGMLGSGLGEMYRLEEADRYLREGLAIADELDLEYQRTYIQAWQALIWCYQGRWDVAARVARALLARGEVAVISRVMASLALGRVRARRGDPEAWIVLDQALEMALATGTLQRLGPVRAARAEAAWLAGDVAATMREATAALELALAKEHPWFVGELAYWRWKAGHDAAPPAAAAEPYALQIEGRWREAADAWALLGCPYEQARALAEGDSGGRADAARIFVRLGARPALEALAAGEGSVVLPPMPRGPRPSTKHNPGGLTNRQVQVLELLAEGRTNAEIATALIRSEKTIDHHVSAILGKLGVRNRTEAAQRAAELGLARHDGSARQDRSAHREGSAREDGSARQDGEVERPI